MADAIRQVKEELGSDAIIYQTRRYRKKGFWWMDNKGGVEVMAGAPEKTNQFSSLIKEAAKNQSSLPEIEEVALKTPPGISIIPPNLEQKLEKSGVKEEIIKELSGELTGLEKYSQIKELILAKLPREKEIKAGEGFPRVVALIGPAGTGKTTSMAKLAESFVKKRGKRVVILSQDTRRLGAIEEAEIISRRIGVEMETVQSPDELTRAVERFFDADLILLDTAGCNPLKKDEMLQMKGILRHEFIDERLLVLSINTRIEDLENYRDRFSETGISGYVFTKLDETNALGNIINLAWKRDESIGYVSSSKEISDDLGFLRTEKLVDKIFG